MTKFRNNAPLPHLEKEIRTADEREAIGVDPKRRKFSARDMLRRISEHSVGQPITLREGDENLHEVLEDSGLVSVSRSEGIAAAIRTDAQVPAKPIETLTFRMEQIHEIRMKLLAQKPAKKSD